jgi:WD40 repeat protein
LRLGRSHLLVTLFFIIVIIFSYYVSNYTTREKGIWQTYKSASDITSFEISYTGSYIVVGDSDGSVSLLNSRGMAPSWIYFGKSPVSNTIISSSGDYLASIDENGLLSLFSFVPTMVEGKIVPLWSHQVLGSRLESLYSIDGLPPLVYVIVSDGGRLTLFQTDGKSPWEFDTGASDVRATIASDGSFVAAACSNGDIYFINILNGTPLRKLSTGLYNVSIDVTINGRYVAAGGGNPDGGGKVLLISENTGEYVFEWQCNSSVKKVEVSSGGDRVVACLVDGSATVLQVDGGSVKEKWLSIPGGFNSFISSPFGSYLLGAGGNGKAYFVYLSRPAPLWYFQTDNHPKMALSQDGRSVFLGVKNILYLFTNTEFSEIFPGSRLGWAIIFFSIISGVFLLTSYRKILSLTSEIGWIKAPYLVAGSLIGIILGTLITRNFIQSVLIWGLGTFVGILFSVRGKGVGPFLSGCLFGFLASGGGGFVFGLMNWIGGDEMSIFQLVLVNSGYGFMMGLVIGIFGATLGSLTAWRWRRCRETKLW